MSDAILTDAPVARSSSAVSWSAIVAGVVGAMSLTIVLVSLGAGLGLSAASPWALARDAGAFGVFAGVWLVVVQWLASALGGYLTGRMRTRWIGTHEHEVFFRDTGHGFLTWATATVVVVALATLSTGALGGKTADVAAQLAAPDHSYDADTIYRSPTADEAATAGARAQAERILVVAAATETLGDEDRAWLVASASAKAGIAPDEALRRVNAALARDRALVAEAKQAADKARKAAARLAMLTALSLVIGAFIASVSAVLGGRLRDEHP